MKTLKTAVMVAAILVLTPAYAGTTKFELIGTGIKAPNAAQRVYETLNREQVAWLDNSVYLIRGIASCGSYQITGSKSFSASCTITMRKHRFGDIGRFFMITDDAYGVDMVGQGHALNPSESRALNNAFNAALSRLDQAVDRYLKSE